MDTLQIDWQASIRRNVFYSNFLMFGFVLLCFIGGFVADVVINSYWFDLNWQTVAKQLISLERQAYAIYIISGGSLLLLIFLHLFHRQLMLIGLDTSSILTLNADSKDSHPLHDIVISMSQQIGLSHAPSLYIAHTPVLNAFVSGLRQKNSILVITQGLLETLKPKELQAILLMQLAQMKAYDQRLTLVLAYVSNIHLIIFDLIYHPFLYGKNRDKDPNPIFNFGFKCLKTTRFLLPVPTFLMRFILRASRITQAQKVAVSLLKSNRSLARALKKINDIQFEKMEEMGEAYSEMALDEIRREAYVFDPADISKCQTFASPFTTHPTLDEQFEAIGFEPQ